LEVRSEFANRAANFHLSSQDMSIVSGDAYPIGNVKVEGKLTEVSAAGVGKVPFSASGDTNFVVNASRKTQDDIKIEAITF
jgi:hypothetical protein